MPLLCKCVRRTYGCCVNEVGHEVVFKEDTMKYDEAGSLRVLPTEADALILWCMENRKLIFKGKEMGHTVLQS